MAGVKGQITRSRRGKQRSVYLSDLFGIWQEDDKLHFTFLKKQDLHTYVSERDGLLYETLMMLYRHGLRAGAEATGTDEAARPAASLAERDARRRFNPQRPPNLLHTRVLSASLDGQRASNWNALVAVAHRVALARLRSVEALRNESPANVVAGRRSDGNFRYHADIGVSIQAVDANSAWRYSLHLAQRLGVPIQVTFEWRRKKGAARPGKQGSLEWSPAQLGDEV